MVHMQITCSNQDGCPLAMLVLFSSMTVLRAFSIYEGELSEMSILSIEFQLLCSRHSNRLQTESIHQNIQWNFRLSIYRYVVTMHPMSNRARSPRRLGAVFIRIFYGIRTRAFSAQKPEVWLQTRRWCMGIVTERWLWYPFERERSKHVTIYFDLLCWMREIRSISVCPIK